ncbi:putative serine/threonine-protein kinase iksA [Smittium culicis]|uniref:non-specific serine/threonine protein kinase n=1 Tax=Smittium culicis TaxID=133412 RepID=A0A1R1Y3X0_9FUNG|nr:putative serine/threonine-protein kinase iksA [Smittium culicis]
MKYSHLFPNKSLTPDPKTPENIKSSQSGSISDSFDYKNLQKKKSKIKIRNSASHSTDGPIKKRKTRDTATPSPDSSQKELVKYEPLEVIIKTLPYSAQPATDLTATSSSSPLELTYHNNQSRNPEKYPIQLQDNPEYQFIDIENSSRTSHVLPSKHLNNNQYTDPSTSYDSIKLSESSFNHGYYKRFFQQGKKLGRGLRGSVYLCQHVLDNVFLGEYAVKKVAVGNNHSWLQKMLKEVKLLESLSHPNIIEYKHSWLEMHTLTSFGPPVPCLFILMGFANGGNLHEYMQLTESKIFGITPNSSFSNLNPKKKNLRSRRDEIRMKSSLNDSNQDSDSKKLKHLSNIEIWSFFSDVCSGLDHLHKHGIIHRDLKPQNLLLNYEKSKFVDETVKSNSDKKFKSIPALLLTDFGECEVLSNKEDRLRTGATGTMEFMAPELLKTNENGSYLNDFSTKADMWSLGMLLIKYPSVNRGAVDDIDPDFILLINILLNQDKKSRPNVSEILPQVLEKKEYWESRAQDVSFFQEFSAPSTRPTSPTSAVVSFHQDKFGTKPYTVKNYHQHKSILKKGVSESNAKKNSTVCEISDDPDYSTINSTRHNPKQAASNDKNVLQLQLVKSSGNLEVLEQVPAKRLKALANNSRLNMHYIKNQFSLGDLKLEKDTTETQGQQQLMLHADSFKFTEKYDALGKKPHDLTDFDSTKKINQVFDTNNDDDLSKVDDETKSVHMELCIDSSKESISCTKDTLYGNDLSDKIKAEKNPDFEFLAHESKKFAVIDNKIGPDKEYSIVKSGDTATECLSNTHNFAHLPRVSTNVLVLKYLVFAVKMAQLNSLELDGNFKLSVYLCLSLAAAYDLRSDSIKICIGLGMAHYIAVLLAETTLGI